MESIPKVQGALVSLDPENGALRAVVGGFHLITANLIVLSKAIANQDRSLSLYFAAALESGQYTPDSLISDAAIRVGRWQPKMPMDATQAI